MSFKDLVLHKNILKAIEENGFTAPTSIQSEAIPKILEGLDIFASSRTGSGKTAAFILPALHKLTTPLGCKAKGPRVLILVPTRELAMQVATEAMKFCKHLQKSKVVCIYGGVPYPMQRRKLMAPYEILVATPGRLMDFVDQRKISFDNVELFVLDEADRMLDMGFIEDVEYIAEMLPKERQTLLFSATLKDGVLKLCKNLLNNPYTIKIAETYEKHENITQQMHSVDNVQHKHQILEHFLKDDAFQKVLIFTSTKIYASQLTEKLTSDGHYAGALHGDMSQKKRTQTITQFRKGNMRILVATDVASRGIDVPNISHVINFDLPRCTDDYIHRIGRTGRAGVNGHAISFVSPKERSLLREIEQKTGQKISFLTIPGLEAKEPAFEKKKPSNNSFRKKRFGGGSFQQRRKQSFKKRRAFQ